MAMGDDTPSTRSGLDKFYADNFILAIIVSVCCGLIGLAIALVAFITSKDPKAKNNAMICLIISAVLSALGLVAQFGGFLNR